MAQYTPLQLTSNGQNALAKAQTGTPLQFTKVKFGDGTATDISSLTDLVRPVLTVPLTSTSIVNGIVKISCLLSNSGLANGFYLKEIGIFATQNGQEFLYAYTKATEPDFIPPFSNGPITQQYNFQFTVQPGANISFVLPNDAVVLQTEKGQAGGIPTLDENAKVPTSQLPIATPTTPGAMSAADKSKLDGIQAGAKQNQNAFSNVKVGATNISADTETDTLELVAGSNITLTPDAANDKVTISAIVPVSSVNGKTGAVNLTAADVGAETPSGAQAKVDLHAADSVKHITSAERNAWNNKLDASEVVTSPTPNKILKLDGYGKLPTSITGNADGNAATASKLQTPRTISLTGDVSGSTSFDGSANATITATLPNTGVTPGTYPKVTVDAKGRVTAGQSLSAADIPNLDWSKIVSGKPTTLSGYGIIDGIKNAGGIPSFQAGEEANRPSAGTVGRLYIATDSKKVYRDNGTSWDVIAAINWSDIAGKPTTLSGYGINDAVPNSRKINAGAGLNGGGDLTADRTLSVSFGGNGSANTVARSDHNHDASYVKKSGDTMTGDLEINSLKTKNLNGHTSTVKWYKVARIQNENPIAGWERATFTGILFVQRDFGNTANQTIGQINFSFGVRGGTVKPVIFATGDGITLNNNSGFKFRVYKNADGWHYLYFMKPVFSSFATFLYRSDGCTEYWIEEDPSTVPGLTLVWDSDNGEVQDVYVGKKKVWHEGNDGPGSGLDADTIDGKHFSDIQADAQAKADSAKQQAIDYINTSIYHLITPTWEYIPLINGVEPYSPEMAPKFFVFGRILFLVGAVKNITGTVTIGYLPAGLRPVGKPHYYIQSILVNPPQAAFANWQITTSGAIMLTGIGGTTFSADKMFNIDTYFVLA